MQFCRKSGIEFYKRKDKRINQETTCKTRQGRRTRSTQKVRPAEYKDKEEEESDIKRNPLPPVKQSAWRYNSKQPVWMPSAFLLDIYAATNSFTQPFASKKSDAVKHFLYQTVNSVLVTGESLLRHSVGNHHAAGGRLVSKKPAQASQG